MGTRKDLPVAKRWFSTQRIDDGLTLITEPHMNAYLLANIWLVRGRDRDMLVDSGNGLGRLRPVVEDLGGGRPIVAAVTHFHADHMGALHEFDERVCHRLDAPYVEKAEDPSLLLASSFSEEERRAAADGGYEMGDVLIDALPAAGFDPEEFANPPTPLTRVVEEGEVIDLGDRTFEVLHLPGHTPGSIGLWESSSGTLFTGDAIYESGQLLDELPGSSIPDYVATMERLREVPVEIVHGGHDPSFGRERFLEVIDDYLAKRG